MSKTLPKWKPYTIRFPVNTHVALGERYSLSYPDHRKSFNQWIVDLLEDASRKAAAQQK